MVEPHPQRVCDEKHTLEIVHGRVPLVATPASEQRWCRFLRQGHKVDFPMKRTIQDEDTQTV